MIGKIEYDIGTENVFDDLGLSNAEERLAKAKLASKIVCISNSRKLTQKKLAQLLEIDQPKVSALYHGRLSAFSISRLIKFLNKLEQDVEIIVKDHFGAQEDHFGHLSVTLDTPFSAI